MTAIELTELFNNKFGLNEWPKIFEVDPNTYANICQELFSWKAKRVFINNIVNDIKWIELSIGPNDGIMFRNVELILKPRKDAK